MDPMDMQKKLASHLPTPEIEKDVTMPDPVGLKEVGLNGVSFQNMVRIRPDAIGLPDERIGVNFQILAEQEKRTWSPSL